MRMAVFDSDKAEFQLPVIANAAAVRQKQD
jgi:hypothetical protein